MPGLAGSTTLTSDGGVSRGSTRLLLWGLDSDEVETPRRKGGEGVCDTRSSANDASGRSAIIAPMSREQFTLAPCCSEIDEDAT